MKQEGGGWRRRRKRKGVGKMTGLGLPLSMHALSANASHIVGKIIE